MKLYLWLSKAFAKAEQRRLFELSAGSRRTGGKLVPQKRTVTRQSKTFPQTYWVDPSQPTLGPKQQALFETGPRQVSLWEAAPVKPASVPVAPTSAPVEPQVAKPDKAEKAKNEIAALIKKHRLSLAPEKGPDSIRVGAKLSAAETAELKARKPELLAALREAAATREAEAVAMREQAAAARRERETADRVLIDEAKKGLPALLAQIPADATRVAIDITGYFDGDPNYRYTAADGTEVTWSDVTYLGHVEAKRPNGTVAWVERVAYIPNDRLEAIRAEKAAKAAAKAAKKAEAEAKRAAAFELARDLGQPAAIRSWTDSCNDRSKECSTDILTEYALPDGSTRTDRVHTY